MENPHVFWPVVIPNGGPLTILMQRVCSIFLFMSQKKTVMAMEVPTECLVQFGQAIVEFWEDATYIYNESIENKPPSLEMKLAKARVERRWRPRAP